MHAACFQSGNKSTRKSHSYFSGVLHPLACVPSWIDSREEGANALRYHGAAQGAAGDFVWVKEGGGGGGGSVSVDDEVTRNESK